MVISRAVKARINPTRTQMRSRKKQFNKNHTLLLRLNWKGPGPLFTQPRRRRN